MRVSNLSAWDKMRNVILPSVSEDLAELVGIHIGDGHLGSRTHRKEFLFQISGHSIKDKKYYESFVMPLIKRLFNIQPGRRFKKTNWRKEISSFLERGEIALTWGFTLATINLSTPLLIAERSK